MNKNSKKARYKCVETFMKSLIFLEGRETCKIMWNGEDNPFRKEGFTTVKLTVLNPLRSKVKGRLINAGGDVKVEFTIPKRRFPTGKNPLILCDICGKGTNAPTYTSEKFKGVTYNPLMVCEDCQRLKAARSFTFADTLYSEQKLLEKREELAMLLIPTLLKLRKMGISEKYIGKALVSMLHTLDESLRKESTPPPTRFLDAHGTKQMISRVIMHLNAVQKTQEGS